MIYEGTQTNVTVSKLLVCIIFELILFFIFDLHSYCSIRHVSF